MGSSAVEASTQVAVFVLQKKGASYGQTQALKSGTSKDVPTSNNSANALLKCKG